MDLIFWFSATGNSLYAAKQLSEKFGNAQLIQMINYKQAVGGEGKKVGFACLRKM